MKRASITVLCMVSLFMLMQSCSPSMPAPALKSTPVTSAPIASPLPSLTPAPSLTSSPSPTPTVTALPSPTVLPALFPNEVSLPLKSICLQVTESGDAARVPVSEAVTQTLTHAGFTVLGTGADCEATLTFQLEFNALGGQYVSSSESCYDFSGASLSGQATLSVPGRAPLAFPINDKTDPQQTIYDCKRPTPDMAPFSALWPYAVNGVLSQIWGLPMLVNTFGVDSLWGDARDRLDQNKSPQVVDAMLHVQMRLLADRDPDVRKQAASALHEFPAQAGQITTSLIPLLSDPDSAVRMAAAETLGGFGPQAGAAVPGLIGMLQDPNFLDAESAVQALGEIGPAAVAAVPSLIPFLKDTNSLLVDSAVVAVGKIGPGALDAAPYLLDILKSDLPFGNWAETRIAAAQSITQVGGDLQPALLSLVEMTRSHDEKSQQSAIELLSMLSPGTPAAIPYLVEVVHNGKANYGYNRAEVKAITALGLFGPAAAAAIPDLRVIAADTEDYFRVYALSALALIGDIPKTQAAASEIQILQTVGPGGVDDAVRALGQLGPEAAGVVVPALLQELQKQLADDTTSSITLFFCTEALGKMGEKAASAVPLLKSMVAGTTYSGNYAAWALGKIGAPALPAVPDIITRMKTETSPDLIQGCADALKGITGQDLGTDPNRWDAWWQQHK